MTPAYEIRINGTDVSSRFRPILLELRLVERSGDENDVLDITVDNRDYEVRTPASEAEVRIAIGYEETGLVDKGMFHVKAVTLQEAASQMTISCAPPDMNKDIKSQRNETYDKDSQKLKDVLEKVAKRHKLEPKIAKELGDMKLPVWHQNNESDIHTLRRLARRHDGLVKVKDKKLIATKRGTGKTASGQNMARIMIRPEGLIGWRATIEGRPVHRAIVANWKDHLSPSRSPVKVKGEQSTFKSSSSGSVTASDDEPRMILPQVYPTEFEAFKAATARKNELSRGKSSFTFTAPGKADFTVEAVIIARGFPERVDGEWSVTQVEHIYTSQGYTTKVDCEKKTEQEAQGGGTGGQGAQ